MMQEYDERLSADIVEPVDDLLELVFKIVPHHMQHNAEAEAVDLLIEVRTCCRANTDPTRRKELARLLKHSTLRTPSLAGCIVCVDGAN